jgi:hypothetical protein
LLCIFLLLSQQFFPFFLHSLQESLSFLLTHALPTSLAVLNLTLDHFQFVFQLSFFMQDLSEMGGTSCVLLGSALLALSFSSSADHSLLWML